MFSGLNDLITQVLSFFQWWIVIAPWERAIRVRWGKKINVLGPGIHFRIPALDRFFVQQIRLRYMNTPTQTITTQDKQVITVSGGTSYTIEDIGLLYSTLSDPVDVIQMETMALVSEFISDNDYKDVTPGRIESFVTKGLDFKKYGLGNVSYLITDFACARTYRIINTNPKDYSFENISLNTTDEKGK